MDGGRDDYALGGGFTKTALDIHSETYAIHFVEPTLKSDQKSFSYAKQHMTVPFWEVSRL